MPKFLIEREIPEAGKLTDRDLKAISQKSCRVLRELGPELQWIQSYVTDDKLFCVYIADSPESIREHAAKGGFPVTAVHRITGIIDPATAECV